MKTQDWQAMAEACEWRTDEGKWVAGRVVELRTTTDGVVKFACIENRGWVTPDRVRPVAKVEPDSQEEIVYVYGSSRIDDAPPPTQPAKSAAVNRAKFEAWIDAGQPDMREWWPSKPEPTVRRAMKANVDIHATGSHVYLRHGGGQECFGSIDSAVARVAELIAEHERKEAP